MKNSKKDLIFGSNFIIFCKQSKTIEQWRLLLLIFQFYFTVNNPVVKINYKINPLYASFKGSLFKTVGKWFRLIVLISPTILVLRLALDYKPTWWWFTVLGLALIVEIPALILFIYDCSCKIRVLSHNLSISTENYVIGRSGRPGGGKTSSLFYDMKILSDLMWKKISNEYKLLRPYFKQIPFWNEKAKEDAYEIIEAYEFYQKSKTYPCLWTSVPAFVDGVPTNRLNADHLMQRVRLPYGSVCLLDEISLILPQELFHDKPIEIRELCKFPRHMGEFHISTTEQGKDNMLIDLRRSMSENKNMIKQKWILKPRLLISFHDFVLKHSKKPGKLRVNLLRILERFYSCIGYRKYYYYDTSTMTEETISTKGSKTKTFILPPYLNVSYDNRAFKNIYRCSDKKLKIMSWEHLRLSKKEIEEIFTKELEERANNRGKRKNKKTQNQSEKTEKRYQKY